MRTPVSLEAVLEAMELQNADVVGFVNPQSGNVHFVASHALAAAVGEPLGLDPHELAEARAILAAPGMLRVPDPSAINELGMMHLFAEARDRERDRLRATLRGPRPVRRFKDACADLGIVAQWYAWRAAEYERVAVHWCEAQGLAWTRTTDQRGPDA